MLLMAVRLVLYQRLPQIKKGCFRKRKILRMIKQIFNEENTESCAIMGILVVAKVF